MLIEKNLKTATVYRKIIVYRNNIGSQHVFQLFGQKSLVEFWISSDIQTVVLEVFDNDLNSQGGRVIIVNVCQPSLMLQHC